MCNKCFKIKVEAMPITKEEFFEALGEKIKYVAFVNTKIKEEPQECFCKFCNCPEAIISTTYPNYLLCYLCNHMVKNE
jgi:hypothetical protein